MVQKKQTISLKKTQENGIIINKKMFKTIQNNNIEELNEKTFKIFKEILIKIKSDKITIALSGGRTLLNFYNKIIEKANEIDKNIWEKIIFCFADERLVPKTSNELTFNQLKDIFFQKLVEKELILNEQIIAVDEKEQNPHEIYSNKINHVDIALLGTGEDSHTASLFPNHPSIEDTQNKYILVENSPKLPIRRISMSKKMIESTPYVFIFFIGESKKEAYKKFLDTNLTEKQVPSKITKNAENLIISTDL